MPLLSLFAPDCPVQVTGLSLTDAKVARTLLTHGMNPLQYLVEWRDDGILRKKFFTGDQVQLVPGTQAVLKTVLATGTPVKVVSMDLPNAVVFSVKIGRGKVATKYEIEWSQLVGSEKRKATFAGEALEEKATVASRVGTVGRLGELGAMVASLKEERTE